MSNSKETHMKNHGDIFVNKVEVIYVSLDRHKTNILCQTVQGST